MLLPAADIVILIDLTGSMAPGLEELVANLSRLADRLFESNTIADTSALDLRVKVVGFRNVEDDPATFFDDNPFARTVDLAKEQLRNCKTNEGITESQSKPQSLLDALFRVAQMPVSRPGTEEETMWRDDAIRLIAVFTDAPYRVSMSINEARGGAVRDVQDTLARQRIALQLFAPQMPCYEVFSRHDQCDYYPFIYDVNRPQDAIHALCDSTRDVENLKKLLGDLADNAAKKMFALSSESNGNTVGINDSTTTDPPTKFDKPYLDENVEFTVYRPKQIEVARWYPLLAFAHLSELPDDAPPEILDPNIQVRDEASRLLGLQIAEYKKTTQESQLAVPREGEITLLPRIEGVEFNPPRQTFLWLESVHRSEFRIRASSNMVGQIANGQLSVFLGNILLADVTLRIRVVDRNASRKPNTETLQSTEQMERTSFRPYQKIFASYSHKDLAVVQQFEEYAAALGDRYLRDWTELRAGEVWNDRLMEMIDEANVFQLFWSRHAMESQFVEQEWRYALSLNRPHFVRGCYWEDPFPELPQRNLPPDELRRLHFYRFDWGSSKRSATSAALTVAGDYHDFILPAELPQEETKIQTPASPPAVFARTTSPAPRQSAPWSIPWSIPWWRRIWRKRTRLEDRLESLSRPAVLQDKGQVARSIRFEVLERRRMPEESYSEDPLTTRLRQAGYIRTLSTIPFAKFLYRSCQVTSGLLGFVAGVFICLTMLPSVWLLPLITLTGAGGLLAVGWMLPSFWLRLRKRKLQSAFRKFFREALTKLIKLVDSGHGLVVAMQITAEQLENRWPVAAQEWSIAVRSMQLGMSTVESIRVLASRADIKELQSFSETIQRQYRMGGSLSEALHELRRELFSAIDTISTLSKTGERLRQELDLPVRYIESVEHNGKQWTKRCEWECFKDGQWQPVEGRFFRFHC